jgi:hypothetical protein
MAEELTAGEGNHKSRGFDSAAVEVEVSSKVTVA